MLFSCHAGLVFLQSSAALAAVRRRLPWERLLRCLAARDLRSDIFEEMKKLRAVSQNAEDDDYFRQLRKCLGFVTRVIHLRSKEAKESPGDGEGSRRSGDGALS